MGRIQPGHKLPSVRQFARVHKVNPKTIHRIYRRLAEDGYVQLRAGSGAYIAPIQRGTLDGDRLNEIHLDGVEVPVEQRIGPEDGAWKIMSQALADERHIQFPPKRVQRDFEELLDWLRARGISGDAAVRR